MSVAESTCGCGCSQMTVVTEAEEACSCGCQCCTDAQPKSKEQEIAELRQLLGSVNARLAELEAS